MKYGLTDIVSATTTDCLVIGLFAHEPLVGFANTLNEQHHQLIARLAQKLENKGDALWQSDFANAQQLMLIHCGEAAQFNQAALTKIMTDVANSLLKQRVTSATLCIPPLANHTADQQLECMVTSLDASLYQLLDFKSDKKSHRLESIAVLLPDATSDALHTAYAIAEGVSLTRTLANLPANVCTPAYLAEQAHHLATQYPSIKTTVLHQADLETLGMGALLAVAKGSHEPPAFIEIHYCGAPKTQPVMLVGKGITFDSGGISLKPPAGMEEMKYDMAGAASVLGTLKACAEMQLPINIIGLLACTENMPGGGATKPGDIIKTLSGQTVEITNTDAEGRLVLADALTYAEQFNPRFVIDIATLTGAIIIALGHENTGFMTSNETLAQHIIAASTASGDKAWRMPLDESYQEALSSPLADMINAPADRSAGSVTAACFLSRFTKKYPWAHLDIAGTAWVSGKKNHATGRPVPLLTTLLRHVACSR